jgi:hypothetical protein
MPCAWATAAALSEITRMALLLNDIENAWGFTVLSKRIPKDARTRQFVRRISFLFLLFGGI